MINLDRKAAERVRIGPFCRMGLSPRISKIQKVLDRSVKYYFRFTWHTTGVIWLVANSAAAAAAGALVARSDNR